ncbi:hypothetical protein RN001_002170 [Aquatica leii]|uniref:Uncharacterized protein n=1 Tax=Aquatica leii TaxID=1421715 RepID=A0AAN7SLQ0_9COLE|nr:hypothetical protein RN001_002170 [Aquatica leii]
MGSALMLAEPINTYNEPKSTDNIESNIKTDLILTYSGSYTRSIESSTTTLNSLVGFSPSSFDDSEDDFLISTPKKRPTAAAVVYHKISDHELNNYIICHLGGSEVIKYYKEKKL